MKQGLTNLFRIYETSDEYADADMVDGSVVYILSDLEKGDEVVYEG